MKAKMPPTIPRLWKLAQHAPTSALNTAKQFPHCSHCTKYTFCTLYINHLTIYAAFWPPCKFHTADTAAAGEQLRVWCGPNYDPAARQLIFVTHFTANETQATEPTLFSRNENFQVAENVFLPDLLLLVGGRWGRLGRGEGWGPWPCEPSPLKV